MKHERVLKYQTIESFLLQEISSGRYGLGERFFTEGEIAIRFGTTAVTARKAFAALEERGYIMRRRGSGTYVRKLPERPRQLAMTTRCVIGLVTGENGVDNQLKIGRMIFALHRAIEEAGYLTMLGGENPEALLESGVHGVIVIGRIAGNWVRKLTESGIPVAALYPDPEITLPGIRFDYAEAARRICREFRERGARHVLLTGTGHDAEIMLKMFDAPFREACEDMRLSCGTAAGDDAAPGLEAWLSEREVGEAAVFALNAWSLPMIERALKKRKFTMGRELSLLVHGSNALLIPGTPGYSIIDIDPAAAGCRLVELLRELIREPGVPATVAPAPYGAILDRGSLLAKCPAE